MAEGGATRPYVRGTYVTSGSMLAIEKWNGDKDFEKWQWRMKAVLMRNEVHPVVFAPEELTEDISVLERREMEKWAFTTLQLAMGDSVISEISGETTAKGIWDKLEALYMKKSLTNRLILMRTFFTYKMKEGSSLKAHLAAFDDLLMKMKAVDLKVDEEQKAMILLCSLPERYTGFSNSLIYGRDTLTLDDVKTGLLSEELRDQMRDLDVSSGGGANSSSALVGERKELSGFRKGGDRRHGVSRQGICYYCKKPGHWKNECPDLDKKRKKGTVSSSSIAVEEDFDIDGDVLTAVASQISAQDWILDSGASFHMTPNRDWFSSYMDREEGEIRLGNDDACKSLGVGTVRIRMHDGVIRTLTNVRYVPGLRKSLIS